jgi:hypothetical protein
MLDVIS